MKLPSFRKTMTPALQQLRTMNFIFMVVWIAIAAWNLNPARYTNWLIPLMCFFAIAYATRATLAQIELGRRKRGESDYGGDDGSPVGNAPL